MIQNVFRAEGLPLDLAYIPLIESAFKPNALSKASAKGAWQFMKRDGAGARPARPTGTSTSARIPEKATVAAAKYLKTLSKMFDGDWHLVLAAYNGGPGRVSARDEAVRHRRLLAAVARRRKYLPRETREYVPLILAAMVIARNPAQYGFEIVAAEPIAYEKVALPRADRPAPRRRMGRHDGRRDPGAEPGAAPLDDAGQVSEVRGEGAGRHGRQADGEAGRGLARRLLRASSGTRRRRAKRC